MVHVFEGLENLNSLKQCHLSLFRNGARDTHLERLMLAFIKMTKLSHLSLILQ